MTLTKSKTLPVLIPRLLLGLIYFVFGLNFFLHFIPNNQQPTEKAAAFLGGLFQSGYLFPLIKTIEVVAGALLLLGLYVPLVLVILMPITLNVLMFHSVLMPGAASIGLSIFMLLLQLYLAWSYREYYKHFFTPRPAF